MEIAGALMVSLTYSGTLVIALILRVEA